MTTALVAAAAALIGALGSQLIAGLIDLKTKRVELYFGAKQEAYGAFVRSLGEFALNPAEQAAYIRFLAVSDTALLLASDDVVAAMSDGTGINVNAGRLRQSAIAGAAAPIPLIQCSVPQFDEALWEA